MEKGKILVIFDLFKLFLLIGLYKKFPLLYRSYFPMKVHLILHLDEVSMSGEVVDRLLVQAILLHPGHFFKKSWYGVVSISMVVVHLFQ